jgi:hypothetical protein
MTKQKILTKPFSISIFWGVAGGFILILTHRLFTNGLLEVSPYPLIMIASILTILFSNREIKNFKSLFMTGLLTGIFMMIILLLYIVTVLNPGSGIDALGYFWRLVVIIAIAAITSFLLSFFLNLKKPG